MRIAIVGGTGPFGVALATRLREAQYAVVLGSRDAARSSAAALELGVEGATNEDAVRGADLVVLATNADAALDTARLLRDAIGSKPVLCVASELRFTPSGVLPSPEDAFVCGDDAQAKGVVLEVAEKLTAGRAFDAGPLASARALEGMIAVVVNLNKRYRGHAGIRVTGLP